MAELRATVVNGDLEVTGNIIPWGGERTAYAYIGHVQMNCEFGSLASQEASSEVIEFTPNLLSGTDYFTVDVVGGNYGNMFSLTIDQSGKTFSAKALNVTASTHTVTVVVLVKCYKKL